jgi:hypothetical protein
VSGVVKVRSKLENAVELRLFEMLDGDHVSYSQNPSGPTARRKGDGVVLRPGILTEVDEEFWNEWSRQNENTGLAEHIEAEGREGKGGIR